LTTHGIFQLEFPTKQICAEVSYMAKPETPEDRLRAAVESCIVDGRMSRADILAECERDILAVVFHQTNGIQTRMADRVGVHRNTLSRRFRELGLRIAYKGSRPNRELVR
jgi:DNA-binding NtrC family response regulator